MSRAINYEILSWDLQNWMEDNSIELVGYTMPRLIALAELRVLKDLQMTSFDDIVTGTMTIGDREVTKPVEWIIQTLSLAIVVSGKRIYLLPRELGYVEDYDDPATSDAPLFYADKNESTWIVTPNPDLGYTYSAHVILRPAGLDVDNPSNTTWLSTRFPELLMYACMVEATHYIVDDERVAGWNERYKEAAAAAINEIQNYRRSIGLQPLEIGG